MDYRDPFRFARLINIYFYTSNVDKLLQARLHFGKRGLILRHFRGNREPYDEDYSGDSATLLEHAIEQVANQFKVRSCFFIEDTSLRIEALSDESDFPGLKVKEWFATTTFREINESLVRTGNDRRVVVKSDIALHVPGLSGPIFFHSHTAGQISKSPPRFAQSFAYPWLTPNTFNGWFIPDGQNGLPRRLGEMEIEHSRHFDFRAKNLELLIDRYIELNAAANLTSSSLSVRDSAAEIPGQLSLNLPSTTRLLLVVGHKCAGKTTFGDIANRRDDVQVFEASSLFRGAAQDRHFRGASDSEALVFLEREGMDLVAAEAAKIVTNFPEQTCIVTGLRTVEEVLYLKQHFGNVQVVLVDSDERLRFERLISRAREPHISDFAEFRQNDEHQKRFGLLRIARDIADVIITNDAPMDVYIRRVDDYLDDFRSAKSGQQQHRAANSESFRSLKALQSLAAPSTCEEISRETKRLGHQVRKYNTNRALKQLPEFAERIETRGEKIRYQLLPRALELIQLIEMN